MNIVFCQRLSPPIVVYDGSVAIFPELWWSCVMLCCVYTVINKLGLAGPEASPKPAQTVRCYQTIFCSKLYWTDRKQSLFSWSHRAPCHRAVVTLSSLLWLLLTFWLDTVVVVTLLLWLWGRRRRLAETFSSSGVWAEGRERDYRQLHWYTLRA